MNTTHPAENPLKKEDIMKMMKRTLSILLTIVVGIVLLTSCGQSGSSQPAVSAGGASAGDTQSASDKGEPTKVVFAMQTFNVVPPTETIQTVADEVNRYIRETYPEVNIELEWVLYGPGDYTKKINLMMQSGDQLDIFIPSNIATSLSTNQLAPITEALETYGQDLTAIIKEYCGDDVFETVTQNGEIMAVPANKNMGLAAALTYDRDMLADVGFKDEDITDLDSLEPIFEKLREKYPDVYPFVSTDVANKNLPYYFYAKEQIDSIGNDFGVVFGDSGKVVNLFETEEYRALCEQMKMWYDKGFMPQDMATSTMRGTEYMNAGRGFCTYASYGVREDYTDFGKMQSNSTGRNIGAKKIGDPYLTTDFASAVLGIPSTSKAVNETIQFLNIAYTDEYVYNTLLWGLEGRDYVKVTEDTVDYPEGLTADTVPYCAFMTMGEWGTESYMWGLEDGKTEEEKQANRDYALTVNKTIPKSPYYGFRFDGSDVKNEITALTNVFEQYAYPLMCGSVDVDSTLEEFNKALYDAGLQTVMDAKQEQLDAWVAQNS